MPTTAPEAIVNKIVLALFRGETQLNKQLIVTVRVGRRFPVQTSTLQE